MKQIGKNLMIAVTSLAVLLGACLPFWTAHLQNRLFLTQKEVRDLGIDKLEIRWPLNSYTKILELHEVNRHIIPIKQGMTLTKEEAVAIAETTLNQMNEYGIFPKLALKKPLEIKPQLVVSYDGRGITAIVWYIRWMDVKKGDDFNFIVEISDETGKLTGLWYYEEDVFRHGEYETIPSGELLEKWSDFCCSYYERDSCRYVEKTKRLILEDDENIEETLRISLRIWGDSIAFD